MFSSPAPRNHGASAYELSNYGMTLVHTCCQDSNANAWMLAAQRDINETNMKKTIMRDYEVRLTMQNL